MRDIETGNYWHLSLRHVEQTVTVLTQRPQRNAKITKRFNKNYTLQEPYLKKVFVIFVFLSGLCVKTD